MTSVWSGKRHTSRKNMLRSQKHFNILHSLSRTVCYQLAFPHESTHTRAQQQLSTWTSISHSRMDSCQQWKLNWIYLKSFTLPLTQMYLQSREWNESFFFCSIVVHPAPKTACFIILSLSAPGSSFLSFYNMLFLFFHRPSFHSHCHIVSQKKVLLMSTLGKNHSFLRLGLSHATSIYVWFNGVWTHTVWECDGCTTCQQEYILICSTGRARHGDEYENIWWALHWKLFNFLCLCFSVIICFFSTSFTDVDDDGACCVPLWMDT